MTTERDGPQSELTRQALALIMAGGNGNRLRELTRWHAKPALPFGGQYRNIDFPLSNCVNSGIRRIGILTQYMAHSLIQHVQRGWMPGSPGMQELVEIWPAQQRRGPGWYAGTADAVFQNIDLIERQAPEHVLVLAGDHVYKMDYAAMLETHVAGCADVTIGCVEVPIDEASHFGIVNAASNGLVVRFDEKPARPEGLAHDPSLALASMGIYVFDRAALIDCLEADARDPESGHDFGHDVLPALIERKRVLSHPFRDERNGGPAYWRDVGTVDSYWAAHMELLTDYPGIDLHDASWPLRTYQSQHAPLRIVGDGLARGSIVSAGCTVAGHVERSVLSTGSRVHAGARVAHSVVLPGAEVGPGCRVDRAIIDGGCRIPAGTVIGPDLLCTAETFHVSPQGVALVTAEALDARRAAGRRRRVA